MVELNNFSELDSVPSKEVLSLSFYARATIKAAKELLGNTTARQWPWESYPVIGINKHHQGKALSFGPVVLLNAPAPLEKKSSLSSHWCKPWQGASVPF